ncbi:MAG TPA: hypothetical protein VHM91_13425 [Verrucomicrobiales bacterium]|nr:hypothetical protein [Verrucomicrobiales bacterium]
MKKPPSLSQLAAVAALLLAAKTNAQVNWEAYNDHRGGVSTAANTTVIEMRGNGVTGTLKNFETGGDLAATMSVEEEGASDDFGANGAPDIGSPADTFFTGKCTIGGVGADGIPGVRNSTLTVIRLRFSNLDPTKRYKFRGTTCRGVSTYIDRWSIFKIVEADNSVAAHTIAHVDGNPDGMFTAETNTGAGILPGEVVLNSGNNLAGSLVGWDDIDPGADGTFAIEARQYVGTAPFGTPAAGPYGYGLNVMYLAELSSGGGGGVGTVTSISGTTGDIKIEWTGPGTLQQSGDLKNWLNLPAATSPYHFTGTSPLQYFRLHE